MYVANFIHDTVSVIDTRTNTVTDTIPIRGRFPSAISFNPYNGNTYVDNSVTNNTSVIDARTNTVIAQYPWERLVLYRKRII